jgi:predicted ribosome quality control (RQC) complex YloA/Tae2 family protein
MMGKVCNNLGVRNQMALDGLLLHALTHELQVCVGGRINKIHQPSEHDLVLQIRSRGQNLKLLLSANPTYPRVHLTEEQFLNPTDAPMFCMLMRKHCESGTIQAIEQVGAERIIRIHVKQRDELGDESLKVIIIELMGRHSNIILTDANAGTILDGIHHITPAISSYRIVMPGSGYVSPPEQNKENPFTVSKQRFFELMSPEEDISQELVSHFNGISPLAAKEIAYRAANNSTAGADSFDINRLWEAFAALMDDLLHNRITPNSKETSSGKLYYAVYELTHLDGTTLEFDTVSTCLESFYGDKAERDVVKQRTSDLLRFLHNEISKNRKKIVKLQETLEEAKDADRFRIIGELLTASLHAVRKGDKSIEVINYYDEEQKPTTIQLDPLITPSENAQRYFKRYTKSKNSLAIVQEQMEEANKEIGYLDNLLHQLQTASMRDIEEIREELGEGGYVRQRGKSKARKQKKNDKPILACYTSSEGIPIYVGKNNKQNEYLTCRLAGSSDTWLHTKDIPGSHVVIRAAEFGEATLHEASILAAYYSQGKASSSVPVDYTQIKYVHKPNGAKPGYVIYTNQKTLFITPDESIVKSLPVSMK